MPEEGGAPQQASNFKIKVSYWYVSNKLKLRRVLTGFLILLNIGFFGFSIFTAGKILIFDDRTYQANVQSLSQDLVDYGAFREANKPKPLQVVSFSAVSLGDGRFDYVALVKNPNSTHIATKATFELRSGGAVLAEKEGFVYPEEEKYVMVFGEELSGATNPVMSIKDVSWKRIQNYHEFFDPRLQFEVDNIDFKNARDAGLKGSLAISTLTFDVTNNSAFSYWNAGLNIVLKGGSRIVGANYILLDSFKSGETRNVEVRFYEKIPSVSNVEVLVEVDLLDDASYIPVE